MSSDPADNLAHAQPPGAANTGPAPAPGAEILDAEAARFLASLQQRLTQTQSAAAEIKARESALAEQAKVIEARKAEVESREREFENKQNQFAARAAEIEAREREAVQAAAQAAELKAAVERAEQESAQERARLIAEGKAAQQKMEAEAKAKADVLAVGIERARAAADARRAEAEQIETKANERVVQADQREHELDERDRDLARDAKSCAEKLAAAEAAETKLTERRGDLDAAERAIAQREKEAKILADGSERQRAALERRAAELEKGERAFHVQQEQTAADRDEAARRKSELDRRETSVLGREQQIRAAQEELERRRVVVNQSEAQAGQLEATSRHLREQAEQIKVSAERQVAQWQDKATESQFQAESALQQVQKLQEQLAAAQTRARSLEEEMDQVKVLGVNLSPEAQARVDGLMRKAEVAEQRAATLQEIIDQHSDEVAKAEARYDAVARQLDQAHHTIGGTSDAHAQQTAAWRKEAEKQAAELAAAVSLAQRAQSDAQRLADEVGELRRQSATADERTRTLSERLAAAEQAARQADERLKVVREDAVKNAGNDADARAISAAQERAVELEAQLKKREAEVAELRAKVTVAESGGGGADGFTVEQRRRLEAELAQREEALSVLANRLLNSEERAVASQAQLDRLADELHEWEEKAARGGLSTTSNITQHGPTDPAIGDTRRRRLRRVREMLSQEHRKVLLAKEALGRHKAEADAVLQQRARLSQLAQSIQSAEVDANKNRARSTAASVIIAAMTTLLAVGGVGYLGASALWPSAYAARATLAADIDGGRSPTDEQRRTWLAAHERLATDPQVYTLAAEKFLQRGMRDLGNPAAVQERFTDNLALVTSVPGQITLEHRGVGRENAARELETFSEALSAIANSRRDTRADGLATSVNKQAEAGADPLDSKRQTVTIGAMAAGFLAALVAGFGLYRLMARMPKTAAGADPLDAFERNLPVGKVGPSQRSGNAAA